MQVLDWRLPMGAGYQEYANAIFCAAADALLAPPMQAPRVLSPWLSPVDSTVLVDGLPMWQGALRLAPQTSATDAALAAVSNAEIPSAPTLEVALAATLAFEDAHSETGQTACVEPVTAEAAGKALSAEIDHEALDALGLARGAKSRRYEAYEAYEAGAPIAGFAVAGFATPVAIADDTPTRWPTCADYEAQHDHHHHPRTNRGHYRPPVSACI